MLRNLIQEMRELGPGGTAFRLGWEAKVRSGIAAHLVSDPPAMASLPGRISSEPRRWPEMLWFPDPRTVAAAMEERVPIARRELLLERARAAGRGRILCFGRWIGHFGDPIDWHLNPLNGERWNAGVHWTASVRDAPRVGDVKLTWEVARFPHAYLMARAAAWHPDEAAALAGRLAAQIEGFVAENPWSQGIHWMSGQETVFRLMAWLFAFDVLLSRSSAAARMRDVVGDAILAGAAHVEGYLEYARRAVYNNHLLSEALGLYLAGSLFPSSDPGRRWLRVGGEILTEQAGRQFYTDGAYIQHSHTYHRLAAQVLIWACLACRAAGGKPAPEWTGALERSLDFLVAHQNPGDGRLPNYGSNDGALPSPLSSCDFTDFRPTLQAVSLLTRGERIYEPGPWDEQAAWLLGPMAIEAPLRAPDRCSVSFGATGYHVLRGREPATFAAFRCGTLRDRFSQVDMLHLDVWWRGLNVLVDAGSYLYNGPARWHEHFFRTACHNTVALDGHDQMLHTRRFKVVYWTRASLLSFRDGDDWSSVSGEHYGYQRRPGGCVHRRSVLFMKDELWIVADTILGTGSHAARLHWLGGQFPFSASPERGAMRLDTPLGPFGVTVFNIDGSPAPVTVVAGQDDPPRGWLSRYYAEKVPVPSMAADVSGSCPMTLLSILGPVEPQLGIADDHLEVRAPGVTGAFTLTDGILNPLRA